MNSRLYCVVLIIVLIGNCLIAQNFVIDRKAEGRLGLVCTGEKSGSAAGLQILDQGGNAADAAVASLLVLSITRIGAFCIGGEVPFMFYDSKTKKVTVLSGQGRAPLNPEAIEWYLRHGIPGNSMKAAAVPAVVDLCVMALKEYGTMSFSETVQPALEILDRGGPTWYVDTADGDTVETGRDWYMDLSATLHRLVEAEKTAPGDREQKLQAVTDRFYKGDIADELERWYIEMGGFLRKVDLEAHRTLIEAPVSVDYRGYTIYKCGPWTQGPYLCQSLRLIEALNLQDMGLLSAEYIHVVTEVMKLALADRDEYYGDPLFSDIPLAALLSDEYTSIRMKLINRLDASSELRPGDPIEMKSVRKEGRRTPGFGGTTTCCVIDRWGNMVAATPSGLASTAGTGGTTGITHGTRLVIFNTWRGHPNCIEAGKRPRTTLTPTIVLKEGKPVLAISVAGGDMQDQVALQLILDWIDFGMTVEEAIRNPRFSTGHFIGSFGQDPPRFNDLRVQSSVKKDVIQRLADKGHSVRITDHGIGGAVMVSVDPESGLLHGAGGWCGVIRQNTNQKER